VEEIATQVGILYDGQLVAEGPPTDLKDRMETDTGNTLEDVFLEVTTDDAYEMDN
jgi:ABC-2 type transport system ATP-binding protein